VRTGAGASSWRSGPTDCVLGYIIFSGHVVPVEPSTWWSRVLFTTRLEIAARAPCLHTIVRGTPDLGYRQKLSPRSSLWPTSAPGLPRAVHGTRHDRPGLPRRVARVSSLRTARRRRRTATPRGLRLLLRLSQLRLGAETSATSAHGRRGVTTAHVLYTPTVAIVPRSVARSSNSRSASVNGVSRPPRTAPLLAAGLARKGSTAAR
jgi:hypothetical protein